MCVSGVSVKNGAYKEGCSLRVVSLLKGESVNRYVRDVRQCGFR